MSLLERLHRLEIPTPFHVGTVNAYLLEGEPLTLLDCGTKTEASYQALVTGLAHYGYQIRDLQQLIISHHHTDHIGLTDRIVAESGAELLAHRYTVPFLETPRPIRAHYEQYFQDICREGAVPETITTVFHHGYEWIEQFSNAPVKTTRILDEGDMVDAGGAIWQVYHTPGHAGDLICLFEPESRVLLANDHLILNISSNPLIEPPPVTGTRRPRRLLEYIHHMQRMAALNPNIAYSGHGDPIEDVPGLVARRLAFHEKRAARILEYFHDAAYNLWELTQHMFAHIPDTEKFLALSEVLGHVDMLEHEGKIGRVYRDGIVYWQRVANTIYME